MSTDMPSWLLSSQSFAIDSPLIESNPLDDDFETWFLLNGGYLHPSVEVASDANNGNFLRAKEGHHLLPGSTVVSCPHKLTLSWTGAHLFHFPGVQCTFSPHVATRLFLIKQYLLKKRSPWWPYIASLPRSFHTPLYYDSEDMAYIRGSNLGNARTVREDAWHEEYDAAIRSLFSHDAGDAQKVLWTWFVLPPLFLIFPLLS